MIAHYLMDRYRPSARKAGSLMTIHHRHTALTMVSQQGATAAELRARLKPRFSGSDGDLPTRHGPDRLLAERDRRLVRHGEQLGGQVTHPVSLRQIVAPAGNQSDT